MDVGEAAAAAGDTDELEAAAAGREGEDKAGTTGPASSCAFLA